MKMRFIGTYTGGRTWITIDGVTFEGREPADVPAGSRLLTNQEFEAVEAVEAVAVPATPDHEAPLPKRGRPRNAI